VSATAEKVVVVKLGPPQAAIMEATERFIDVEGAFRSAKTWTCLMKVRKSLEDFPGIVWFMARWKDQDLHNKLIPDYRKVCALMGVTHGTWNARESCYDFANGSRLYAISLKSSENTNVQSKVRGLTVAGGYIDQLEEVPFEVYEEAALRLSQPGYPQQMLVSPNPVSKTHWIAKEFPESNDKPNHRYISLAIWDNAHNLSPETIAAAEERFPVGHVARPTKIEGRRGVVVRGTPVYSGAFDRVKHVGEVLLNPSLPLIESYDFGFHHPAVLWLQWAPWGQVSVLGGLMGQDLHLDAFLPIVQRYRAQWFPRYRTLLSCCDPSGSKHNSHGLSGNPVSIMKDWYAKQGEHVVSPQYREDANTDEARHAAHEVAASYMRRTTVGGEQAFRVDGERWRLVSADDDVFDPFFLDGLEAGYVLKPEPVVSQRGGLIYKAEQDGWFCHSQNCFEYGVQNFVLGVPVRADKAAGVATKHAADVALKQAIEARIALRNAQRDTHPIDAPGGMVLPRGGRRMAY
jgi:hypothetical protein